MTVRHYELLNGCLIEGPFFKSEDTYMTADSANPEVPWPGYGWPLGSTCWWYRFTGRGLITAACSERPERALERARYFATCAHLAYVCGSIRGTGTPDFFPIGMEWSPT